MERKFAVAFEGGGSRGCAHAGVYQALQASNILEKVNCAGGTSIGALFALFVSMRLPAEVVLLLTRQVNISNFLDKPFPLNSLTTISRYVQSWGLYNSTPLFRFVRKIIADRVGEVTGKISNGEETLSDLYQLFGCHLITTATNINNRCSVELNARDFPSVPAFFAVAISMVVPHLFAPVEWNKCYWVDGGLANGLPVKAVSSLMKSGSILLIFAFRHNENQVPAVCVDKIDNESTPTKTSNGEPTNGKDASDRTPISTLQSATTILEENEETLQKRETNVGHDELANFLKATAPIIQSQKPVTSNQHESISTNSATVSVDNSARGVLALCVPKHEKARPVSNMVDYILGLFQTLNDNTSVSKICNEFGLEMKNTCWLETPGINSFDMQVDVERKNATISAALDKTTRFLSALQLSNM